MDVVLKMAVRPELVDLYQHHVQKHNASILTDPFPNCGFDLFVPAAHDIDQEVAFISMGVQCEMVDKNGPTAFYLYPRSSISKTPLMLANHVGIIDSGYRGFLIGAFRNLSSSTHVVEKETRLLQVCHPSLRPIHVVLVDESELSTTTRGSGGFGSTTYCAV